MSNIKTIMDHIGRNVIGTLVEETDNTITLNNPVIIHVQPNPQNGQLQVQSFPYIFMEFLAPGTRDKNNWTFSKTSVAVSDVELDGKIIMQYNSINSQPEISAESQASDSEPEVIKLFED
jgi:hypothetical protein